MKVIGHHGAAKFCPFPYVRRRRRSERVYISMQAVILTEQTGQRPVLTKRIYGPNRRLYIFILLEMIYILISRPSAVIVYVGTIDFSSKFIYTIASK
jgi:hypothetical protein